MLSAHDLGIVGDGATDCAAALQAALDTYLHVYLPPGEYVVRSRHRSSRLGLNEAIALPSGATLQGAGPASVIVVRPAVDGLPEGQPHQLLTRGLAAKDARGVAVRDLAIRMQVIHRAGQAEQGHAVIAQRSSLVKVRDVVIEASPDGDGVYLGTDVEWATIDGLHVRDAARNALTIEGAASAQRRGILAFNVTQEHTSASDPAQRGGRLVDAEVSGPGSLDGLRVVACYGPGGLEVGNTTAAVLLGNVASRLSMMGRRVLAAANIFRNTQTLPTFTAKRTGSALLVGNWLERVGDGYALSIERGPDLPPMVGSTDYALTGNRIVRGLREVRAVGLVEHATTERETLPEAGS